MTLGFSTTWPDRMGGGPTHFPEKIWARLDVTKKQEMEYFDGGPGVFSFTDFPMKRSYPEWKGTDGFAPKIHTIREDPHNRWRAGMKIHMAIGNRTPNRFQFAPTLVCTDVQYIQIMCIDGIPTVFVGDSKQSAMPFYWENPNDEEDGYGVEDMKQLAINDGFDSIEHFFQWFNEPFVGKLIHWTDFKY